MESKLRTRRDFLKGSAVAVGAAVLTACAPAAAPAGDTAESGGEMAAAEEILIRFAMWDWYANTPGVRWDEWNQTEAFPLFEEANPGTKLEWEPLGSGWPDKILTQMAAGHRSGHYFNLVPSYRHLGREAPTSRPSAPDRRRHSQRR